MVKNDFMIFSKNKSSLLLVLVLLTGIFTVGCKSVDSTQKSINVPDEQVTLRPQKLPRKAIRLKGEVTTEVMLIDGRKMFNLRVQEVEGIGANFKTKEPESGEVVSISAPSDVDIEKGELVLVDVSATVNKTGDKLMFNLLRKVVK